MHISDGILSGAVAADSYALAIGLTALGLWKTKPERLPQTGVIASAFFVASLIHVPIGPTSEHLVLNGLAGVVLGISAFPAIFVALFLQALLFGHGGVQSLGFNACAMGIPALAAWGLFELFKSRVWLRWVGGFLAGSLAVAMSGAMVFAVLVYMGDEWRGVARYAFVLHVPVMAVEGLITASAVAFLARVKPEILRLEKCTVP